jgi:uncharacterized Zn finger protein (UPF0148 family)
MARGSYPYDQPEPTIGGGGPEQAPRTVFGSPTEQDTPARTPEQLQEEAARLGTHVLARLCPNQDCPGLGVKPGSSFCPTCGSATVHPSRYQDTVDQHVARVGKAARIGNAASRFLLAMAERQPGETQRDAIDRTVRAHPEEYLANRAATLGGAGVAKSQSAADAIEEAVSVIVSKSNPRISRAEARDEYLRTEAGQRLFRLHQSQAAVLV